MIRMTNIISALAVIFLCLIFGLQSISAAEFWTEQDRIEMQIHIDKAKIEKPKEYKAMVDKAGTIINCVSCHDDLLRKRKDTK